MVQFWCILSYILSYLAKKKFWSWAIGGGRGPPSKYAHGQNCWQVWLLWLDVPSRSTTNLTIWHWYDIMTKAVEVQARLLSSSLWCLPSSLVWTSVYDHLKPASLVYKVLNTGYLPWGMADGGQYHKSARSTRSSASHLLSIPRHILLFGAKIWNSIPLHVRQSQTYSSFRRHLKTHYFQTESTYLAPSLSWHP